MKIQITIECENEAFTDRAGEEIHDILKTQSKVIRSYVQVYGLRENDGWKIRDTNGNSVGKVEVIK